MPAGRRGVLFFGRGGMIPRLYGFWRPYRAERGRCRRQTTAAPWTASASPSPTHPPSCPLPPFAAKVAKQSLCQIGGDGLGDHPLDGVSNPLDHAIHTFGKRIEENRPERTGCSARPTWRNSFKRSLVSLGFGVQSLHFLASLACGAAERLQADVAPASINSEVATTQLRALRPACEPTRRRAPSLNTSRRFCWTSASSSSGALLALIASSVSAYPRAMARLAALAVLEQHLPSAMASSSFSTSVSSSCARIWSRNCSTSRAPSSMALPALLPPLLTAARKLISSVRRWFLGFFARFGADAFLCQTS